MKYFKSVIAILIFIAIALSAYMFYTDHTGSEVCIVGSGCSLVRHSSFGEIFGIEVSLFGVISFAALSIIHFQTFHKKIPYKLFLTAAYIGAIFALYFLYLQFFIIKAICPFCLTIDSTMIIIAGLSSYEYFKLQK